MICLNFGWIIRYQQQILLAVGVGLLLWVTFELIFARSLAFPNNGHVTKQLPVFAPIAGTLIGAIVALFKLRVFRYCECSDTWSPT